MSSREKNTDKLKYGTATTSVPIPRYHKSRAMPIPEILSSLAVGESVSILMPYGKNLSDRIATLASRHRKLNNLTRQQFALRVAVDPLNDQQSRVWRVK